ncbi:MAG: hypothetical protein HY913_17200 [Desulfomonile tiedjei]|nr:hypothetical protein [Desulfomonile tiedjei]
MAKDKSKLNQKYQVWIEARQRHKLSDAQVQMARELGMNPEKLGKLDNHNQEPWKMPLKRYIEHLYFKRLGRERPDVVMSIEELVRCREQKKAEKRETKLRHQQMETANQTQSEVNDP